MNRVLSLILVACFPVSAVQAYDLRYTDDGQVLIWNQPDLAVHIDATGVMHLPGVEDAVRTGYLVWTSSGAPYAMTFSTGTEAPVDRPNVVRWVFDGWNYDADIVAITVTSFQSSTKFVTHTDILMNAQNYSWTTQPEREPRSYDVENVMAHEAGHFFGMGHEPGEIEATMYPYTPPGETTKRSLHRDDLDGLAALVQEIARRTNLATAEVVPVSASSDMASTPNQPVTEVFTPLGGCTFAEPRAASVWCVLLLVLFALRRYRRCATRVTVLAAAVLLIAASAQATTVRGYTIEEMAESADLVVEGEVIDQYAVAEGQMVYTEHAVKVQQCLRGTCRPGIVTLRTMGGQLGDQGVHVDGVPRVRVGERLVLFGRKQGGLMRAVGVGQGVFKVKGRTAMRDLRDLHLAFPRKNGIDLQEGRVERFTLDVLRERITNTRGPVPRATRVPSPSRRLPRVER